MMAFIANYGRHRPRSRLTSAGIPRTKYEVPKSIVEHSADKGRCTCPTGKILGRIFGLITQRRRVLARGSASIAAVIIGVLAPSLCLPGAQARLMLRPLFLSLALAAADIYLLQPNLVPFKDDALSAPVPFNFRIRPVLSGTQSLLMHVLTSFGC